MSEDAVRPIGEKAVVILQLWLRSALGCSLVATLSRLQQG